VTALAGYANLMMLMLMMRGSLLRDPAHSESYLDIGRLVKQKWKALVVVVM